MPRRPSRSRDPFDGAIPAKAKALPQAFVLDELAALEPRTKPMFGCMAVYVGERIVLILRERGGGDRDDGVWIAFDPEHEAAVRKRFVRAAEIDVFQGRVRGWLKLAASSRDFEDDVLDACALIRAGDAMIGKIPNASRRSRSTRRDAGASAKRRGAYSSSSS